MSKWLWIAQELSKTSPHPHHKLAAVVVKGGRLLSRATNGRQLPYGKWRKSRHAEMRALRPHMCYDGATLFVARSNGLVSVPCPRCMTAIVDAGISRVVCIGSDGMQLVIEV